MAKDITTIDRNLTLQPLIENITMAINDAHRMVAYGTSMLTELFHQLTARLGRRFGRHSLINMRKLYLVYPNCQTLSDDLSWSHIGELIKIDDNFEHSFYEKQYTTTVIWGASHVGR